MTPAELDQVLRAVLPPTSWTYINTLALVVTAGIVLWYTIETNKLRTATQAILGETLAQNQRMFVLESQKMLIDLDNVLMSHPTLGKVIGIDEINRDDAFGYMVLNVFDIVLHEGATPAWNTLTRHAAFRVWKSYCEETLRKSPSLLDKIKADPQLFQNELVELAQKVNSTPRPSSDGGLPEATET